MTEIPFLDVGRQNMPLIHELQEAFSRVLSSGQFILGPEVAAFESECAAYLGVEHTLAVSSGTDAILLALMALGIGQGDEVICPTYTFFATAGCIARTGATPVFVDSDPRSFNIDPAAVQRAITPRTKAMIPVHLFGQCADMEPLITLAAEHGIVFIEDAAQAIGATYNGRKAGTFGAFGCFSLYPSKNLGGFGDCGFLTSTDAQLLERARVLRSHGSKPKYFHQIVGGNFRADALQCALIGPKFRHLDEYQRKRQENASLYDRLLDEAGVADAVVRPWRRGPGHVFNQYVVLVASRDGRDRDGLQKHLADHGVGTEIYYPLPLHLQECFRQLGGTPGDCPNAERAARDSLALPIFPELREEEIRYVVSQIAGYFTG